MRLGHGQSLAREAFPAVADASLLEAETVTCVVQVKGKVRDRLQVAVSLPSSLRRCFSLFQYFLPSELSVRT